MKYPKYQLRCSTNLFLVLQKAGPEAVRQALERAFCTTNDLCTTKESVHTVEQTHFVLQNDPDPVLPEPVENSPTNGQPLPAWKAKLAEQIDKAKALKAAQE